MLSMESKLKENHFALESADTNGECVVKNGLSETSSCRIVVTSNDIKGDFVESSKDKSSLSTEHDHASGDKACVKDKSETKLTTAVVVENGSTDDKNELFEDAKSDLNDLDNVAGKDAAEEGKGSPDSTVTDCTQCSVETAKLADESEPQTEPELSKQSIRTKVWDHLDKNDLVVFPRPCQGRIPNFKGAPAAAEKLIALDVFKNSKTIKVNPDKPQEMVRFHTLEVSHTYLKYYAKHAQKRELFMYDVRF